MTFVEVRLSVQDVFHFSDGRLVFVGTATPDIKYLLAGSARLIVNGVHVTTIDVTARMPGPNRREHTVEAINHSVDVDALKAALTNDRVELVVDMPARE